MTNPHDTGVNWPYNDPTPAMINIEMWLFAEFCYYQYHEHTQTIAQMNTKLDAILATMQGQPSGKPLPAADMTAVNQAVTDLQALQQQPA
jgi:hypothetical protein